MFLFGLFGPELIIVLFALAMPVLIIWLIIKAVKGSSKKKTKHNYSSNSTDKISQLERLAALKQKGLLTDAEFQREKNKIL